MAKQQKKKRLSGNQIVFFFSLVVALSVCVLFVQRQQELRSNAALENSNKKVIGFIPATDKTRGMETVRSNPDVFSEISPVAYTLTANGDVILDPAGGAALVDDETIAYLRSQNIKIFPAIHNVVNGTWNGGNIVTNIIKDSTKRTAHINNIVNLVVSKGYDGIDIDYENLNSADRANYTTFMTALGSALHAKGKLLTTDVYGKTSEPGTWNGPQAQDYQAIGAAADEVRIMLYDYSPTSIGPIAPLSWTSSVLGFAKTKMPAAKIIQGVPLYGYDWTGSSGTPKDLLWTEATSLSNQYKATMQWDSTNKVPWFTYNNGSKHTVYFENGPSVGSKLDLTNSSNVGGVSFWRLGGEDPTVWANVRSKFIKATSAPTAVATPTTIPTATITSTETPIPSAAPTTASTIEPTSTTTATYPIFADALSSGWGNASYFSTVSYTNTSPVYQGIKSISFKATKGWAGLGFKAPAGFTTAGYTSLSFALRATQTNYNLAVYAEDGSSNVLKTITLSQYGGYPPNGSWKVYTIPLSALNATNKILSNFTIQNNTSSAQAILYVDQVQLVK